MIVLIDTNVVLDVLCNRTDFVEESKKILKLCEVKKINGYVSALSIANIMYIMRKELENDKIQDIIKKLSLIFDIIDLTGIDLIKASTLNFNDYEDAIQSVQAKRIKANYIITRNINDFLKSDILPIKPKDFLNMI